MQHRTSFPPVLIRFGIFELDLRTGELRKAGVRLPLPWQSFVILAALVERPNELVTREELRARLWGTDTFVDFEHGLNAAVKRARERIGDSAVTPIYIETLPRRGYRFIAPVQRVSPGSTGIWSLRPTFEPALALLLAPIRLLFRVRTI